MKNEMRVYIGFQENQLNPILATQKQLHYIDALLAKSKVVEFNSKADGNRLTLKEATKFIDRLLKHQRFTLVDRDKRKELKSINDAKLSQLRLSKWKAKMDKREKFAEIKKQVVKPIIWNDKPKTFDKVPKMSFEMQQAILNKLEDEK